MYLRMKNGSTVFTYNYGEDMSEIKGIDINTHEDVTVKKEDIVNIYDEICKAVKVE